MFAKLSRNFMFNHLKSSIVCTYGTKAVPINHTYFSKGIVSDDHAWLGGMIVTDGHLHKSQKATEFFLQLQDFTILTQILDCVGCEKRISLKIDSRGHAFACVNLASEQLVNDMIDLLGCDWRRKCDTLSSSVPLFDSAESQHYIPGFVRGVSDGDGSFILCLVDNGGSLSLKISPTQVINQQH